MILDVPWQPPGVLHVRCSAEEGDRAISGGDGGARGPCFLRRLRLSAGGDGVQPDVRRSDVLLCPQSAEMNLDLRVFPLQDYYFTKPHPEFDICYAELQASSQR